MIKFGYRVYSYIIIIITKQFLNTALDQHTYCSNSHSLIETNTSTANIIALFILQVPRLWFESHKIYARNGERGVINSDYVYRPSIFSIPPSSIYILAFLALYVRKAIKKRFSTFEANFIIGNTFGLWQKLRNTKFRKTFVEFFFCNKKLSSKFNDPYLNNHTF